MGSGNRFIMFGGLPDGAWRSQYEEDQLVRLEQCDSICYSEHWGGWYSYMMALLCGL